MAPPQVAGRIQRHPPVRLRRESWGGLAFHREAGDLLELDRPAFDAACLLGEALTGPRLSAALRSRGHEATRAEIVRFLRDLEDRAMIRRVAPDAPPLPRDPMDVDVPGDDDPGLRAPIVASGAHPKNTILDLAGAENFSGEIVEDMRRFRTRGGSVKINMILSEPPKYIGVDDEMQETLRHTGVNLCPSIDYLERAWQEAQAGKPAAEMKKTGRPGDARSFIVRVELWGFEPQIQPCHGRVMPFHYSPELGRIV